MTILSCKTIFGPTFSAILENCWSRFFAKSQKLRFWPKMTIFCTLGQIWPKWEFFSKIGPCYFLLLLSHNFMPSLGKIRGAVSEINSWRTDGWTDKDEIIEPVASLFQYIYQRWESSQMINSIYIRSVLKVGKTKIFFIMYCQILQRQSSSQ